MKVCIAEKPSVAKEIANVLGAKNRKDGYFEGNGYQVTWTFGHLCTLQEPHDYDATLKRWDLITLPIIPKRFSIKLIKNKGVSKQFNTIKSLVSKAEEVINCGDAGQEGELIQRWVLQKAKCTKPVKRLWISSLTEASIRQGFLSLKSQEEFDTLYWAGSSRAIGDWLLGINATRLYTVKYGGYGSLLSIGRVQTPTLAMIVQRHDEIENFVSEPFWELKTKYREVLFSATHGKFKKQSEAEALLAKISDHPFEIQSFDTKEGKESCPKLFDLTSLQVDCNKKLNLSADETLKTAQILYERKFISYPRVDTRFLPDDQYPTIGKVMSALRGYEELVQPLLGKPFKKSKAVFNNTKVTDHHAIIPTEVPANGLTGHVLEVYDMIVKRFIANFYHDCKVAKTQVFGKANEVEFKVNGKQILDPGWRVVYQSDPSAGDEEDDSNKKDKEEETTQVLPEFKQGEQGPHEPQLEEKKTSPPKLFTEATLLRAMETAGKQVDDADMRELMKENGIGRPSTRANIIETLFRRKYISKRRKSIVPTNAGIMLIGTIQNELLKSAELTGTWEKHLRQIESGEYDVHQFMRDMKQMVVDIVQEVKQAKGVQKIEIQSAKKKTAAKEKASSSPTQKWSCPKCHKGSIVTGKSAYGCMRFKEGCDFVIPFEMGGKKLTKKQVETILTKQKSPLMKGLTVNGQKVEGHIILSSDFKPVIQEKEDKKLLCPKCKTGEVIKGNKAFGCARFREGCHFVIPFQFWDKKLTDKQIEALIKEGRSPILKQITNPSGQKVDGRLFLEKDFSVKFENI